MNETIRSIIEEFVYPYIERLSAAVYRDGQDTKIMGIRVLDDPYRFTHGALVNAAAALYVHQVKESSSKADHTLCMLHRFIELATEKVCLTWGKLAILRGFNTLFDEGLLDRVSPDYIATVRDKTDYSDFFDKDTLTLKGYAINYYHVAMACALIREKLGWDETGTAEKIAKKLIDVISSTAANGWMDDEPPHCRFDRYSFMLSSEFADTALVTALPLPDIIKKNLRSSAEAVLFMANNGGNGILYGRSVSCHGDAASVEVLASAFVAGLIKDEEKPTALAYSAACIKKIIDFWYDEEMKSFNIWFKGRTTNYYRSSTRILEVNLDMTNHLLTTLKNFAVAGLADTSLSISVPISDTLSMYRVDFTEKENDVKALIMLKKADRIIYLPFTGMGENWGRRAAYCPIPVTHGIIEVSPIAEYPFMLPEYTDAKGDKYRPCQYYENLEANITDGVFRARAEGRLAIANTSKLCPSDYRYTLWYEIKDGYIKSTITTDLPYAMAETYMGAVTKKATVTPIGYDTVKAFSNEGEDFSAIHGKILSPVHCTVNGEKMLGYTVEF